MRTTTLRRGGDKDTIESLFRAEFDPMVRLAYTIVGNSHEAEEIVQDSFAEIHRRFDQLKRPGAYLRTTVVFRCRINRPVGVTYCRIHSHVGVGAHRLVEASRSSDSSQSTHG